MRGGVRSHRAVTALPLLGPSVCVAILVLGAACGPPTPAETAPEPRAAEAPLATSSPRGPWSPPIGVPDPPFGVSERAPAPGTPGFRFYYVDASHSSATDSGNAFGTPGRPRRTVPERLAAGDVVELSGQYTTPLEIAAEGTAASPVFIRGGAGARSTRPWTVRGTHLVIDNVSIAVSGGTRPALLIVGPSRRVAFRDGEVTGDLTSGGLAVAGGDDGSSAEDIVILGNRIHRNGNWEARSDQDIHGIRVAARVARLWVVDNELSYNSGDGIQISAGSRALQPTVRHVYVARNTAHHNKQMGFWSKQAVDVVFSQNLSYAHRPSGSSFGAGLGFQYAPERIWFLYNHVHDCTFGIGAASDSELGSGTQSFVIGNVLHDIRPLEREPTTSAWAPAGIMLAGGLERVVANNTLHDVVAGIQCPGPGAVHIVNNLVSQIRDPDGAHVYVEDASTAGRSTLAHNLFSPPARIRWGGYATHGLPDFQARFAPQGRGCLEADPQFLQPGEEFQLSAGSPAVDSGILDAAYELYRRLYGVDIARDAVGTPRPQGAAFDMGAYERRP